MIGIFRTIFSNPRYLLFAITVSSLAFMFAVLMPNLGLLWDVWSDGTVSLASKFNLTYSLAGSITTNFGIFSASYTIATAVLLGMVSSMTLYYILRAKNLTKGGIGSASGGALAGFLGVGCAACGSLAIAAFLPFAWGAAILTFLPLEGQEFGILAVTMLVLGLVVMARQIRNSPDVCPIDLE